MGFALPWRALLVVCCAGESELPASGAHPFIVKKSCASLVPCGLEGHTLHSLEGPHAMRSRQGARPSGRDPRTPQPSVAADATVALLSLDAVQCQKKTGR